MDNKEIILNVEKLNTTFISDRKEIKIVKDVSFQVRRGKTLAVVGESGCGKSVTMNSIMRFTGKNAIVKAENIQYNALRDGVVTEYHLESIKEPNGPEMRALRGPDMSMVFQDPMSSLNPVYKVGDQVAEGLLQHNKGMKKAEAREKVLEMFRKLGIPDPEERIDCYPHQFSGGMKQRVVIAMALACSPDLLLADEPTTALDVTIQAQVLELMNELKEMLRTSLLLITHDLGVVAQVCDRVAIMYAGEIVESGTIAEVFDHPHHPYTIGLFGSIPSLDETAEKLKPIQGQMPDPTELPEGCAFAPRCPYATGACRTRKPEMTGVGGTQMVRCLAHQGVFESPELMEEVRHGR